MLRALQADWSLLWRLSNLLKCPAPQTSVGMGPEIKTDFPQELKKDKRSLKSLLGSSDCWRAKSLIPTWTITRLIEEGSESNSPGNLSRISGMVAPGKQRVTALKKQTFPMMESPVIVQGEEGTRTERWQLWTPVVWECVTCLYAGGQPGQVGDVTGARGPWAQTEDPLSAQCEEDIQTVWVWRPLTSYSEKTMYLQSTAVDPTSG